MKSNRVLLALCVAALAWSPSFSFAADPAEEDVTPRSRKIYLEPQKTLLERGLFKYMVAVTAGYDDNARLNSDRKHDAYTQQFLRAAFSSSIDKKTQANIAYDLMNLMYADESDLSLLRNTLTVGIDRSLNEDLILSPSYTFDSINYTRSGDDDWIEHAVGAKLKHRLPMKMYHMLGYSVGWRDYLENHIQLTATTASDKRRNDWRNIVDYEIGRYFEKDWVKFFWQYIGNESNEKYLDYYDYNSYRFGGSLTHLFNDKLSGYLSGYWQKRFYRQRPLVDDAGRKQQDSTYVGIASLYYSVSKELTLGLNYTYRQNESNEPRERYSGSLVSVSTYYRF